MLRLSLVEEPNPFGQYPKQRERLTNRVHKLATCQLRSKRFVSKPCSKSNMPIWQLLRLLICTRALVMAYGGDSDGICSNGDVAFLKRRS